MLRCILFSNKKIFILPLDIFVSPFSFYLNSTSNELIDNDSTGAKMLTAENVLLKQLLLL